MNKIAKKIGAAALSAVMVLSIVPITNPTTVQAASAVTVTSQKQLDQALKKSVVKKITIKNKNDLTLKIKKGTYKASITVNTQADKTVNLTIAKGAKLSNAITVKGKGTATYLTSSAKVKLTISSPTVVRLKSGASGSTVTDKSGVADIRNYTGKKLTAKIKGKNTTIKAAKTHPEKSALIERVYTNENNDSNLYCFGYEYENVLITVDGKNVPVTETFMGSSEGEDLYARYTLATPFTVGEHKVTLEIPGYKPISCTVNYTSSFNGVFWYDPWVGYDEETGNQILYALLLKDLDGKTVTYTIDSTQVTPTNSFVNGDGAFVTWFDASGLSKGEHTMTVTAEGFETSTATFTVE